MFSDNAEFCLLGGRNRATGKVVFPMPSDTERFDPVELPRRGKLWSWTVQRFRPKTPPYTGPEAFEPFAVGYVELPDAVIVESILVDVPFETLRIGMEMELVPLPWGQDSQGNTVLTYAFRPVSDGAQS